MVPPELETASFRLPAFWYATTNRAEKIKQTVQKKKKNRMKIKEEEEKRLIPGHSLTKLDKAE